MFESHFFFSLFIKNGRVVDVLISSKEDGT